MVVAIPVCDEEERIGACLDALAGQVGQPETALGVVLFVNNTTDDTLAVIAGRVGTHPLAVRVVHEPGVGAPNAGRARRRAMEAAARWLEESADEPSRDARPWGRRVILTTDADSTVGADWVARNLAALRRGADAVAGMVRLDPEEARDLPARFLARRELERTYEAKLAELRARLAPDRHDPWPRHDAASGASIAVSLEAYRRVGGMPDLAVGEDLAFLRRVAAHGLRVRHDPAIVVTTSARLTGRAIGGSADAIRLRCAEPRSACDERLEPAVKVVARAMGLNLRPSKVGIRPARLPLHIALAEGLLTALRAWSALRGSAEHRADSDRSEALA